MDFSSVWCRASRRSWNRTSSLQGSSSGTGSAAGFGVSVGRLGLRVVDKERESSMSASGMGANLESSGKCQYAGCSTVIRKTDGEGIGAQAAARGWRRARRGRGYSSSYRMGCLGAPLVDHDVTGKRVSVRARRTWLRAVGGIFWPRGMVVLVPVRTVSTDEAGDALGVDLLAADAKGRLLAAGSALLLFADHHMDLFGLDVLANMPCGEPVFVLLFSAAC